MPVPHACLSCLSLMPVSHTHLSCLSNQADLQLHFCAELPVSMFDFATKAIYTALL